MDTTYAIAIPSETTLGYEIDLFLSAKKAQLSSSIGNALQDVKENKRLLRRLPHGAMVLCAQGDDLVSAVFDKETKTFEIKAIPEKEKRDKLLSRINEHLSAKNEFVFLVTIENLKRLDNQDKSRLRRLNLTLEDATIRNTELQSFLTRDKEDYER